MAEPTQFTFDYREVVEALLKKQDIHEGLWTLVLEFGFLAGNFGPGKDDFKPAAMISVGKIGIAKTTEMSNLTVNAAEVNPSQTAAKKILLPTKKRTAKGKGQA